MRKTSELNNKVINSALFELALRLPSQKFTVLI